MEDSGKAYGPLAGLRVLDISTIVAAPSAAALLGDYGAEVVKVELPGVGDGARGFPPFKNDKPLWWKVINRNKQLITLDLRKPEGVGLFKKLLPRFDVLIENFRPGTLDGWGLDAQTLWAVQPRLVILRATAYGQSGPYRNRPGFARIFEAMSGLTYISGEPDGQPMHAGIPIGDAIGGLFATIGILASLLRRANDPAAKGEEIDLSLTEASIKLMDYLPIKWDQLGLNHERSGNRVQYSAPAGVFKTRDGHWVSLAGSTNALFAANCRAIARPELIDDERFSDNAGRCKHENELNAIFRDWIGAHAQQEALAAFEAAHGTLAPIYSAKQIVEDPQVKARDFLVRVPDPHIGAALMPGVVPRFSQEAGAIRRTGGDMGCDNRKVFGEWLGLDDAEMDRLAACGVI